MSVDMTSVEEFRRVSALAASVGRDAGVVILWALPSSGVLIKFLGNAGAIAAIAAACVGIPVVLRILRRRDGDPAGWMQRRASALMALLLILAFLVLFPIAKSGWIGPGSDRDDALNVTLRALLHGHYPYYAQTYLGNLPTPMPGAMLLALPFFALGTSALQNLFWLPAFTRFSPRVFNDRGAAAAYVLIFLLCCPASMHDFVTGGDFLVNCLYVIFSTDLIMQVSDENRLAWHRLLIYGLFSICLSSRPIFIILLPILTAYSLQHTGSRRAVGFAATVGAVFAMINAPFYLYDPAYFPALNLLRKLDAFPPQMHAQWLIPAIALAVAAFSCFLTMTHARVYAIAAASLAVMLLAVPLYEILARRDLSVFADPGDALPVAIFGGIWLLSPQRKAMLLPRAIPSASRDRSLRS